MPHNTLHVRMWTRRLIYGFIVCAIAAGALVFICQLVNRRLPGIGPDTLAPVTLTEIRPASPDLKIFLTLPPDHWQVKRLPVKSSEELPAIPLLLENDSSQDAGWTATPHVSGSCLTATQAPLAASVPAHQSSRLELKLASDKCSGAVVPQQLLLSLDYTWTLLKSKGKSSTRRPSGSRILSTSTGEKSGVTFDLSIHLPRPSAGPSRNTLPARSYSGSITLSPIELSTESERAWRRFWALVDAIAKDFTWPVLLALLAYGAQLGLARRGERQQVFNAMLPTLTKLIFDHYVPMARRMQTVNTEADKIPPVAPAQNLPLHRTFCAILLMRRRVQHLFNSNGGIFFRSAIGEDLFAICLSGFYSKIQKETGSAENFEALALALSPKDPLLRAQKRIISPRWAALSAPLYQAFANWALDSSGALSAEFKSCLVELFLAESVLSFECNRIYYQTNARSEGYLQGWYFDPPSFYFNKDLNQITHCDTQEMRKLYLQYLNGLPTACRKDIHYPR